MKKQGMVSKFRNNRGFSLPEIMMGMAAAAGVGLVTTQIIKSSNDSAQIANLQNTMNNLEQKIRNGLSNRNTLIASAEWKPTSTTFANPVLNQCLNQGCANATMQPLMLGSNPNVSLGSTSETKYLIGANSLAGTMVNDSGQFCSVTTDTQCKWRLFLAYTPVINAQASRSIEAAEHIAVAPGNLIASSIQVSAAIAYDPTAGTGTLGRPFFKWQTPTRNFNVSIPRDNWVRSLAENSANTNKLRQTCQGFQVKGVDAQGNKICTDNNDAAGCGEGEIFLGKDANKLPMCYCFYTAPYVTKLMNEGKPKPVYTSGPHAGAGIISSSVAEPNGSVHCMHYNSPADQDEGNSLCDTFKSYTPPPPAPGGVENSGSSAGQGTAFAGSRALCDFLIPGFAAIMDGFQAAIDALEDAANAIADFFGGS